MVQLHRLPVTLTALILSSGLGSAFYLPGITPTNYKEGDVVPLNVNRLTPSDTRDDPQVHSAFPYDYYHPAFHHCQPEGGRKNVDESLGSILFGDRIQTSPFQLHMRKDEQCKAVCDAQEFTARDAKFVNRRIAEQYNVNLLIDGLPAGQSVKDLDTGEVFLLPGFKLGEIKNEMPVLHNHYDIRVEYHEFRTGQYRVVGVEVQPFSVKDNKRTGTGEDLTADCGQGKVPQILDEETNTKVTFTYSVQWTRSDVSFATRWDKYLHVYTPKIHWFSLVNSSVIFMFLVGMVSTVLVRTLKKDIARYNRLDQLGLEDLSGNNAEDDMVEDSGWKLVHGDVFRPPKHALALSIMVGNGAQLFMMACFTIAFAAVGFLSPSNRGSLATVMILLYTVFGFVSGYMSSRVYKSLHGEKWKQLFIFTPVATPAFVFAIFFLLNLFVWARQSSGAVPFTTMLAIIGIWFLISFPLSIAGSWLGFKQPQAPEPTHTNQIPRQIPPAQGYLRLVPSMFLIGVLPFGAIFIELYFIMSSLWSTRIYYMFGFLFLSFGLLVVTSAAVTVLMIYFLLCAENYHWQWRAFASSGASAIYVFLYCLLYWARMLSFSSFTGGLLYLGYSLLLCSLWFIMTGTIGFTACWFFTHRIYGSIKVD